MSNKETKLSKRAQRKNYSKQFKADTVSMVLRSGRPASETARELGVSENLVAKWVRLHLDELDTQTEATEGLSPSEMAAEIKRLQRELDRVSEHREILKKALGIVGSEESRRRNS